ncbi:MAG: ribosome-associated protein [Candidatus Pseudothioglobus sp.]|jgi:ribosome-associated protein
MNDKTINNDERADNDLIEDQYDGPSKSQRKRDMHALRDLGERLTELPEAHVKELLSPELMDILLACKKITKGNARKRQIQYLGKRLRQIDTDKLQALIDRFDASTQDHANQFHRLERWRERLINQDATALEEILELIPEIDRQHLRQLTRLAISERDQQKQPPVQFRKLFQYLKSFENTGDREELGPLIS